jgi:hypothetical protein
MWPDTTSFAVHGRYALDLPEALETPEALKAAAQANEPVDDRVEDEADGRAPAIIAVTYGYSRDHREDWQQWMAAGAGDLGRRGPVPQFLQPLDGNASDIRALLEAVSALRQQLQQSGRRRGLCGRQRPLQRRDYEPAQPGEGAVGQPSARDLHTPAQAIVQERLPQSADGWQRAVRMEHATDGVGSSPTSHKAANAGWWCARAKAENGRAPPCSAKRTGSRRRGRSGCGTWATTSSPASPTPRRRWPKRASACRPGSRSSPL